MPPARAIRLVVPLACAFTLLLAGCGSEEEADTSGADGGNGELTSQGDLPQELVDCLEREGVELPEGGPGAGGIDPEPLDALQRAQRSCADVLPDDLAGLGGGGPDTSTLEAFSSCMADNGVAVEPKVEALEELDSDRPPVARALRTCAALVEPATP